MESEGNEEKNNVFTETNPLLSKYSIDSKHNDLLNEFEKDRSGIVATDLDMLTECKNNKIILDIYYDDLEFYNSFIQISIIVVSTIAAFIQAVKSIITVLIT